MYETIPLPTLRLDVVLSNYKLLVISLQTCIHHTKVNSNERGINVDIVKHCLKTPTGRWTSKSDS